MTESSEPDLLVATLALSAKVTDLHKAVQENSDRIVVLHHEVAAKPDDAEVRFIAGFAKRHRVSQRKQVVAAVLAAAAISGLGSYFLSIQFARQLDSERSHLGYTACTEQNKATDINIGVYKDVAEAAATVTSAKLVNAAIALKNAERDCTLMYGVNGNGVSK